MSNNMETDEPTPSNDTTTTNHHQDDKKTTTAATPADLTDSEVPQLEGISFGQLETAVQVLTKIAGLVPKTKKRKHEENGGDTLTAAADTADEGIAQYQHANLRPLRKALAECLQMQQRLMYQGKSHDQYMDDKADARTLKRQKMAERDQQKKYIADTALRRGRIARLKEKQAESQDEEQAKHKKLVMMMMIPDGHVETTTTTTTDDNQEGAQRLLANETEEENGTTPAIQLPKLRSCYVCKARFRELHHFYDQLCPPCAALNWEKRHQTADLTGKVAVVTGSRVKIGYQTCLKLLRAGATVVATTRFPNAAVAAYRQEADFAAWQDRLQVYGLDLRDVTGLEAFCRFLKIRYETCGLDMLINNACQTVRRPTAYYLPACLKEEELWNNSDDTHQKLLGGCVEFERVRRKLLEDQKQETANNRLEAGSTMPMLGNGTTTTASSSSEAKPAASSETTMVATTVVGEDTETRTSTAAPFETTGLSHSAAMSQMALLPEDAGVSDAILPPGVTDINGQQLDLRKTNSWLLKMEQVSTPEVMECMFINAIAPFVLNSRLKPLMSIPSPREDRHIVNVSAMEGKFYRYKMANHPHTNMAKAALNMMTRTSAEDLAKNHGIYMNSIDTGWINDENPLERATKTAKTNLFQTPIDEIDAAARILDPIFTGANQPEAEKDYGKFLKDYRETEW
jgi:NAD(P)-dependent dehydrogenase (short-subunit alcohol dehydrogenase family)